ncbi:hypothetical protein B0H19DRAFT_1254480 [Mycena capillaripes]|nr:hypothetical protein B0H19DRAFT_1254480 [Mycena capillaripes]
MPAYPSPHRSTSRRLDAVTNSTRVSALCLQALVASERILSRPDCVSAFFKTLCERYRPPPAQVPGDEEHTADPPALPADWTLPPTVSTDEVEPAQPVEEPVAPVLSLDPLPPTPRGRNLGKTIYNPHGKWAWTAGSSFRESEPSILLSSGIMCSAFLKTGYIDRRPVKFVSKLWLTKEKWHGFFSELALYKGQLRSLQGRIVPTIINVYSCTGAVDVAMEPPHHSFWIEATADMPHVLKKRCVEAFEKLHRAGVLHGDIELRHMLIGGDARVTIIDFQASRALQPNAAVHLAAATPEELRLEMRKVKFKLDYEGAQKWEEDKRQRAAQLKRRNERARRYEESIPEDVVDPPIESADVWNQEWIGQPVEPTRFVMPGQSAADVERAVEEFLDVLEKLEEEETRRDTATTKPRRASPDLKPPTVVPARPQATEQPGTRFRATVVPPRAATTRQRWTPPSLPPPAVVPTKPPASGATVVLPTTPGPRTLKRKGDCDRPQEDHKRIRVDARLQPYMSRSPPPYSRFPLPVKERDFTSETPAPLVSRPLPAIKAADFAYETSVPRSSAPPREPELKPKPRAPLDSPRQPQLEPARAPQSLDPPSPPFSSKRKRAADSCDESLDTRGRPKMRTTFSCDVSSDLPHKYAPSMSLVVLGAADAVSTAIPRTNVFDYFTPQPKETPLFLRWIGNMWRLVSE